MKNLSRRTFLLGGPAVAGTAALPLRALARPASAAQAASSLIAYPFTLGVTSGDPAPDSVVLWTRLAPSPTNADGQGGMPNADVIVEWQVSANSGFSSLVASGLGTPPHPPAHPVHVVARRLP